MYTSIRILTGYRYDTTDTLDSINTVNVLWSTAFYSQYHSEIWFSISFSTIIIRGKWTTVFCPLNLDEDITDQTSNIRLRALTYHVIHPQQQSRKFDSKQDSSYHSQPKRQK